MIWLTIYAIGTRVPSLEPHAVEFGTNQAPKISYLFITEGHSPVAADDFPIPAEML
jgi:hypothetical protein